VNSPPPSVDIWNIQVRVHQFLRVFKGTRNLKGKTMISKALMAGFVLFALFVNLVSADDELVLHVDSESERAQALLGRAVAYYQANNDLAFATFSRQGEFVDGDLYVYVLDSAGVMLASGGSSSSLIGRNVAKMQDSEGKAFFEEMISIAKANGSGTVEYHWLNRTKFKVEHKKTHFQKVGDRIISVGYYIPRATSEEAKALLKRAAHAVKTDPEKSFVAFNDLNGGYMQDDLYVFVVGLGDGIFRAHGISSHLVGSDGTDLFDTNGKSIIQEMITAVQSKKRGEIDYVWLNPVTGEIENKHTFFREADGFLVAVGFYKH
jgi:cytochrome c